MAISNNFTDTITVTYSGNGKAVSAPVGSYTGKYDAGVAVVVPAGSSDLEFDVSFPHTAIQSCIMSADQNLTVKVNSSGSPTETFDLKATAAMVWATDYTGSNPFGHDVTKLFISNAGATDAKFNLRVLYN